MRRLYPKNGEPAAGGQAQLPKSQRHIRRAFLQLLEERAYSTIAIKDIIKRAEVGRSTFYTYYNNKQELLNEIEDDLIAGYLSIAEEDKIKGLAWFLKGINSGCSPLYVQYFEYFAQHHTSLAPLLHRQKDTGFSGKFAAAIERERRETAACWGRKGDTLFSHDIAPYRDGMYASMVVGLVTTWMERSMDLSAEEMACILTCFWEMRRLYRPKNI